MLKKKMIMLTGATIVTVALLAGVTYAWFTGERTTVAAEITAGKLDIDFVLDNSDVDFKLYPQLSEYKGGVLVGPAIVPGTSYPDVAKRDYTLNNKSDRQVLVEINAAALLANSGVIGSEVDTDDYVVYDTDGDYIPAVLTNPDAVLFYYEVAGTGTYTVTIGNNAYVYLPINGEAIVTLSVWIDGETGGNAYQNAVISFEGLTAKATQYRSSAIKSVFGLTDTNLATILTETGFDFE